MTIPRSRHLGSAGAVIAGLNGAGRYLGTIVATTTPSDNLKTGGPTGPFYTGSEGFQGMTLMVQPMGDDCYWSLVNSGSAASTGSSPYLAVNDRDYVVGDERSVISVRAATGVVYLKVFDVSVDPFF